MKPLLTPKVVALFFAFALVSGQLAAAENVARCDDGFSLASFFSQLNSFGSSQSTTQSTAAPSTAASDSVVIFCSEQPDPFNTCNGCNQPGCTCDDSGWIYSVCCCDSSVS